MFTSLRGQHRGRAAELIVRRPTNILEPPTFAPKWQRLITELVVIVGGILIAFGVDAAWERRQARLELTAALTAARSDLASSQAQLSRYWLPWDEQVLVATITLLASVTDIAIDEAPPPGPDRLEWVGPAMDQLAAGLPEVVLTDDRQILVPDSLLGQALLAPTLDPSLPAVMALLDSGLLGLAEDEVFARALSELPGQLEDLADEEEQARAHVWSDLVPVLSSGNNVAHVNLFSFWGALGFSEPGANGPLEERHRGVTEIRVSQRLVNELATRVKLTAGVEFTAREVNQRLLNLVQLLDEELAGSAS